MKVKKESVIWLFLERLINNISMKRSRRELSIDMIIHRVIFENTQITLFSCFTFTHKTGDSFYCVGFN